MKTGKELFIELVNEKKYTIEEILYLLRPNDESLKQLVTRLRGVYDDDQK